jgi:predicted dehydrogenase
MERRHFLMATAATTATVKASALASPNDTVRVACVGIRGQGNAHIGNYARMKNVEIAALCDVDEEVLNRRAGELESRHNRPKAKLYKDLRKVLEDKDIDVISIATPNHWHTLQTIWSLQAGKDVYVEKPCSHNIFESKQIVAAAEKYGRIVAHGTNSRSSASVIEAKRQIDAGLIGEVYMSRALIFKWRNTIGKAAEEAPPSTVDYDLWTGPAPKRPFTKNRFHYNWHWFWDTGNGDIGNQGIHEVDLSRWLLGVDWPTKVTSVGGKFMFDDDQETPNTITSLLEFEKDGKKKMLTIDVRHWMTNHEAEIGAGTKKGRPSSNTVGNIFYGSKGYLAVDGYDAFWSYLGQEAKPGPEEFKGGNNWQNFIDVVRSRDKSKLGAPIQEGATSCDLMHLANISYRLGRSLNLDPKTRTVKGDPEAAKMFTRAYRKPFVVPEKV